MSVKAFRVINIEKAEEASFTIFHEEKLFEFLEHEQYSHQLDDEGYGLMEIPVETLEAALKADCIKDEGTKKAIKADIAASDGYSVRYYCL